MVSTMHIKQYEKFIPTLKKSRSEFAFLTDYEILQELLKEKIYEIVRNKTPTQIQKEKNEQTVLLTRHPAFDAQIPRMRTW